MHEPFITCAECASHRSCLKCFSVGAEIASHENTHAYVITHDNVKIFPNSNWSAREERRLLDLLLQCGVGNWNDISTALQTKSPQECREHYLTYYFDGIFSKTLGLTKYPYVRLCVPYLFKTNTIEPPRHNLEMIHSKYMAGYRFARSDFDTPYDISAESIVSDLKIKKDWGEDYEDIGEELNCAMVRAYNNRLQ